VGHRVLHGGDRFTASCVIDEPVEKAIEVCIRWARCTTGQPHGIRACQRVMPDTKRWPCLTPPSTRHAAQGVSLRHPTEYYKTRHPPLRLPRHQPPLRVRRAVALTARKADRVPPRQGSSLSAVVNGKA
jgi:hypothetical protein